MKYRSTLASGRAAAQPGAPDNGDGGQRSARLAAGLAAALTVLSGCSGDARPLTEAVEVEQLGLQSLQIRPPPRSVEPAFSISTGQQIQLALLGGSGEDAQTVDASDRRWTSSDPAVASVDSDGRLTGNTSGAVQIGVSIGGIRAEDFEVTVSAAPLAAVDEILGDAELSPCLPTSYVAVGSYQDGSRRLLNEVDWSLDGESDALLTPDSAGEVQVVARQSGTLTLQATVPGVAPLASTLTADSSLAEIAIEPDTLAVSVGSTLDLVAIGRYAQSASSATTGDSTAGDTAADGTTTDGTTTEDTTGGDGTVEDGTVEEDITDYVDWRVTAGSDAVAVGNASAEDKGQLTGIAAGTATVSAGCGTVAETERDVIVSDNGNGADSDEVVFEQGSRLLLAVGERRTLRVSSGTEFDADNVINDVTFVTNDDSGVVALTNGTANDAPGGLPATGSGLVIGVGTEGASVTGTLNGAGTNLPADDATPINSVVIGRLPGTTTVDAIVAGVRRASITIQVR